MTQHHPRSGSSREEKKSKKSKPVAASRRTFQFPATVPMKPGGFGQKQTQTVTRDHLQDHVFPQGGQEKGPPKSLMRWENIGVNVKKNLWKVFPQPQKPGQACRTAQGCTREPKQTTRGSVQCIGAVQILVRQGSFCLKRVQTPAHASGSPHVTLSAQREISACPQMQGFFSAHFPAV